MFKNAKRFAGNHATAVILTAILLMVVFLIGAVFLQPLSLSFSAGPWSLEDTENYLTGPLPPNATDIQYQSRSGNESTPSMRSFESLSFKAPPKDAMSFANQVCYSILHKGYDPFNARDDGNPSNGYLIHIDASHYYYSYSPNAPQTYFGDRCYHLLTGIQQILVDETNPNLYTVKFDDPRFCNLTDSNCPGYDIFFVDVGNLTPNGIPQNIDSEYRGGQRWEITVQPGVRYETIITLIKPRTDSLYENLAHLWVDAFTSNRADWATDSVGPVTSGGLKTTFVGPDDGKAEIFIFWMGDPGMCAIQVTEVKN